MSALATVFFDLDGTLIDHFRVLHRCYAYALRTLGLPVPSLEDVHRQVGGSMNVTMRRFVPEEKFEEAARLWREHLSEILLEDVTLLPGAREVLSDLHGRGYRLGVLTNKIGEHARRLCRHLQLDPYLDLVLGAEDTPYRKPMREFSDYALRAIGGRAEHACLVGDSPYDIDAARAVGMKAWCVTTGTHDAAALTAAGAGGVFESLRELAQTAFAVTA